MPKATKSVTITARITPALAKKITAYAKAAKRSKSQAIENIIDHNIDYEMAFVEAVLEGIRSAEEEGTIPHDEAMRQIRTYIAKRKREKRKAA
jgi:predicted transcriptional regulator